MSIGLFFVSKNDLKIFSVKDYDLFSRERTEVLRRHHLWFVKKIPVSECYQLIIDVNLNVFQGLRLYVNVLLIEIVLKFFVSLYLMKIYIIHF